MATVNGLRNYSDQANGVTVRAGESCEVPAGMVDALAAGGVIAKPKPKPTRKADS